MLKERYVWLIIVIAVVALWFFKPGPPPEVIEVPVEIPVRIEVPGVEMVFDTIYMPTPVVSREDPELVKKYQELKSENEKLEAYRSATRTRLYSETFKDSIQEVTVFSQVAGKLQQQSIHYKTEPRSIETIIRDTIPIEIEPKRNIMFGGEVGVPMVIGSNVVFKGNIMLENKKGQILSVGYDTEGRIWAGAAFKIFK